VALSRREAILAAGGLVLAGGGAYGLLGCDGDSEQATTPQTGTETSGAADCVLTPEQTEGPYYLDGSKLRSDIAEGRDGLPLRVELTVRDAESCEAIENATVELWHCDAGGEYSGVGGAGGTFCRGGQRTDAKGVATFRTVYPGWYQGRAPHIHVKVHVSGSEVHTGQLYFDEAVSESVYARAPYNSRGEAETTNSSDGIYSQGGREATLRISRTGDGYVGRLALGVQA
jgi:protocatechuate 3,4-dioxygenase beta subunit